MKATKKTSLLIRHSDRDEIPQGSFGNEVLLNEKGKQNALRFGEDLIKTKINKIYTSPVERCVQTAKFISKGYRNCIEIIETSALGSPGLHIDNDKVAGEFYLEYGFDEMYRRFIHGESIPGMPDSNELNRRMTTFIKEKTIQNGTTIFITHDMLIAFYHYSIDKTIYTKDNWVNFLTGMTFKNGVYEK